ncbi:succinate dehydrogenase assembly factor 2 [Denitrificimonas sp. JX-1]|uniref:FAD assembly factor SdhE n=1 Tax=Denitrificimonas halotolerans TaxID=3098930 RepID=A0ABU5GPL9_9GAMM|nr:succinate dehydrogenase assembly factor 2 [Denitrificimonas sp. JX-1]MDY7218943.1 succinate dehydrogenase assembly factor 2 [Denitrificimonas sp. JX-1]
MSTEVEVKRLYWHSRRGMWELDQLLVPFVEEQYLKLDEADRERYRALLDCEDQDIFAWCMLRSEPDNPDLKRIVELVLEHAKPK